jgi:hypothetical protein
MPGFGLPKLICAFSEAQIYAALGGGVALFWRGRPVALFPDVETAINYTQAEFNIHRPPPGDISST